MQVEITVSLIEGAFTLSSTVIAAICAAIIGKKFHDHQKLKCQLDEAREDIAFLLAVEEQYGEKHRSDHGSSGKITMRDHVRDNTDLTWSGKHTPGRVNLSNC